MSERPALRELAERLGVVPSYVDVTGAVRVTGDATRVALLAARGVDASGEAEAAAALATLVAAEGARLLAPVTVLRQDVDPFAVDLALGGDADDGDAIEWTVELAVGGDDPAAPAVAPPRLTAAGRAVARAGRLWIDLPPHLWPGPGYHRLSVEVRGRAGARAAAQRFIVTPRRCRDPEGRRFGLCANLYAVRSRRDLGVGDLADLAELAAWCGRAGGAFVGLNPLHAQHNRFPDISPYSPVSRLYRNPIYLDAGPAPDSAELAALRAADRVDYDRVMALKRPLLAARHAAAAATPELAAYRTAGGQPLEDFATFCAIAEELAGAGAGGTDWRTWPAELHDARGPAVAAFRARAGAAIDRHVWMQFELDRQLGRAAARGRAAGLSIGLYQDLAIGSAPGGADPWSFPGLFLSGASIGAPPDPLAEMGQDWGLPPVDPRALAADGYRYWILLVRNALAHSGALRIDHVMGLQRQFWVPAGRPGSEGAYQRYPAHDLLGILALESQRAGALIVGEDLGTVPEGFTEVLADWGVLSTQVLYFERAPGGAFRRSWEYSPRALVTADTHDLAPLAGFWRGRDLELRHQLGEIAGDEAVAAAAAARAGARAALLDLLWAEGVLPAGVEPADDAALVGAVHTFLRRTPAPLIGLWLDDLTAEVDPVNLPGFTLDRYPSWSRRLRRALEDLPDDPAVARAFGGG